ncbi:MAG: VTT domain-containing protein [Candidatus Magasanikbacteria bacterium]|nr:VTT domain-containing protein [Candidatus Magasanikbacteria bacterium]
MFNLVALITAGGYLAVAGIIFAESGLLIGFFLPGDSLLFTAGFLASQGYLNIVVLVVLACIAAVAGDSLGYSIGKKFGRKIFTREDSIFFDKKHAERAEAFYKMHGGKAITLARFMPIVRTFAPVVAGIANMPYHTFFFYNVMGAFAWAAGVPLIGYFAGSYIPNVDHYLFPIILGILVLSILPGAIHFAIDHFKNQGQK